MANCCKPILDEFFKYFIERIRFTMIVPPDEFGLIPCGMNGDTSGLLYNWYSIGGNNGRDPGGIVNTQQRMNVSNGAITEFGQIMDFTGPVYSDERNLWRVPTENDWDDLITYLGGSSVAGGKMKTIGEMPFYVNFGSWTAPNSGATNESKWAGIPNGKRNTDGTFEGVEDFGVWWASTQINTTNAVQYSLNHNLTSILKDNDDKKNGYSIRLVRPATSQEMLLDDFTTSWDDYEDFGTPQQKIPQYVTNDWYDINFPISDTIFFNGIRTVKIGDKVWTAQNLSETLNNLNNDILEVTGRTQWGSTSTAAFCEYNNGNYYSDINGITQLSCEIGPHIENDIIGEEFYTVGTPGSTSSFAEVLDRIMDLGIIKPQCCDTCPVCDYVFASAETYLKYAEAVGIPQQGCCFNYYVNENERNKLIESNSVFETYDKKEGDFYILDSKCRSNFSGCVQLLKDTIGDANFNILMGRSFVENERIFDQSFLCFYLKFYLDRGVTDPDYLTQVILRILDKGFVISCVGQNFTIVASVETYLKFAEAVGLTQAAQVP